MNTRTEAIRGADRIRTGVTDSSDVYGQIHRSWAERRNAYLEKVGWKCERCSSSARLEVHHLNYERLGAELDGDLEALCRGCHTKEHMGSHKGVLADGTDVKPIIRRMRERRFTLREIAAEVGISAVTVMYLLRETGGDPVESPWEPVDPEWFDNPTPLIPRGSATRQQIIRRLGSA